MQAKMSLKKKLADFRRTSQVLERECQKDFKRVNNYRKYLIAFPVTLQGYFWNIQKVFYEGESIFQYVNQSQGELEDVTDGILHIQKEDNIVFYLQKQARLLESVLLTFIRRAESANLTKGCASCDKKVIWLQDVLGCDKDFQEVRFY